MCAADSTCQISVDDQGACAGGRRVQVGCVSVAPPVLLLTSATLACRTLAVICGTIGDDEGARHWSERAREEIDMCGRDTLLPLSDVEL
jgi:hypothetical protein